MSKNGALHSLHMFFFLRKPRYPEQHDPHNVAERGVVFWKHLDPQSALVEKGDLWWRWDVF